MRLLSVERFSRFLERFPGAKKRLFTAEERRYCERFKKSPEERYAARFAAKCAYRACQPSTKWQDMEICNDALGAPTLHVRHASDVRSVSLTHEGQWALASLLVEKATE